MQFQTENVLNSLSTVKKSADVGMTAGLGFMLRNGMFYNVNNIVGKKVNKTAATAGALEKWTIAMPEVMYYAGKVFRLLVDVRLKGDVRSDYDRYSVYKGKPFIVEFSTEKTDTVDALTEIVATIKDGLTKNGHQDLSVSFTGGTADDGFLVVEGKMYSQVFDAVMIQELKETSTSSYSSDPDFKLLVAGTKVTGAAEPFGSAWYITKNLRLPSSSNTRFMAVNSDERPIDGASYNQYSFRYSVERDITGMGAVGQVMTSVTDHIIYVKSDLAAAFETLLLTSTGLSIA